MKLLNFATDDLRKGSVIAMSTATPLIEALEVVPVQGRAYSYEVVNTLVGAEYRELGDEVIANDINSERIVRPLAILTGSSKVDRANALMSNMADLQTEQQTITMLSVGKAYEKKVIAELKGLLAGSHAGKEFTGALTTDLLDDAYDYCKPTLIFVNNKGHRALKKLLKSEGYNLESVESFGQRVINYNNVPVFVSDDLEDNEMLFIRGNETGVKIATNGGLQTYEQDRGTQHITDVEVLFVPIALTTDSFAKVTITE